MMTILDENRQGSKYDHILLVEYYEFLPRIALRYSELKNKQLADQGINKPEGFRHEIIAEFLERFLER